jgi:glycosyltransferase involved in cell wall biosynthesis
MIQPWISVCIPVYNGARTVRATIQSVLDQDFEDFEICIVENASSDETFQVVQSFSDERIRIVSNDKTVPAWENWSIATSMARGKWIKLVCADDLLGPNALSHLNKYSKSFPEARVICGTRNVVDENGVQVLGSRRIVEAEQFINILEFQKMICKVGSNPLGESLCWMWQREVGLQLGSFSNEWQYFIDLDYWLRLSSTTDVLLVPASLGSFRISRFSWTSQLKWATIGESFSFIMKHPLMRNAPLARRLYGLVMALFRGLTRINFLRFARLKLYFE